ncbi:MAG TPA: PepSY-associated TM helix domain-containing protein [Pseudomonadales bacterium]
MTAETIRVWYAVHKWTSLISTLFLLMLCITGLPLIFYHEIDHALGHAVEPPERPGVTTAASLDAIVSAAEARRPGLVTQFVSRDPEEPEAWYVSLAQRVDAPEPDAFDMYDARTGEYLHDYPLEQGFMYVLYRLHLDMYAGLPGTLFLGAMGLLLVASLVSGAVVYGPFMAKLRFGTVRRGRSARLEWLDLHNLLGIATLVWVLVVGFTGVINTLSIPIFAQWQNTELAAMAAATAGDTGNAAGAAGTPSVERAVAAARAALPDAEVSFVAFPGNPFATASHFTVFMQGDTPLTSKLLTPVLVHATTGELTAVGRMPWYVSALLLSQPLHFGDYGGLPLKILWALLDLIAIVVLGSGVYLWVKKRNVSITERLAALAGRADEADYLPELRQESGT